MYIHTCCRNLSIFIMFKSDSFINRNNCPTDYIDDVFILMTHYFATVLCPLWGKEKKRKTRDQRTNVTFDEIQPWPLYPIMWLYVGCY